MPLEYYKKITYSILANDSVRFAYLVFNLITKTFLLQRKRNGAVAKRRKRVSPFQVQRQCSIASDEHNNDT
ncbi:hypothetical protein ACFX2I_021001 [Malus domestica]